MLTLIGRIAAVFALLVAIGLELVLARYGIGKRTVESARRLLGRRLH